MNQLCAIARSTLQFVSFIARALVAENSRRVLVPAILTVVLVALALPTLSLAAPIVYGDFMGNTITYVNVREDSNSGDTPPLFGAPSVFDDSLDFNPVGFGASSTNGGVDVTDGNLAFMVVAKPGESIANLVINEFGDVTLAGIATLGSQTTFASVTANVFIDIVEISGVAIDPIKLQVALAFSPSGGTFGLGTDGGGGPLYNQIWAGDLLVNFTQELADRNLAGVVTKINVNLDNTLVAISQQGTTALIAKKDHVIIKTNIPEPASCLLAVFSLLAGALMVRHSR
jgi:hypothetical protein